MVTEKDTFDEEDNSLENSTIITNINLKWGYIHCLLDTSLKSCQGCVSICQEGVTVLDTSQY